MSIDSIVVIYLPQLTLLGHHYEAYTPSTLPLPGGHSSVLRGQLSVGFVPGMERARFLCHCTLMCGNALWKGAPQEHPKFECLIRMVDRPLEYMRAVTLSKNNARGRHSDGKAGSQASCDDIVEEGSGISSRGAGILCRPSTRHDIVVYETLKF
ncbi:hypothetical protein HRR83_008838 [Exophiala dermatitidis]|uniref:Uncharacterized protein n=2 Tax=Exophiala dermatitidis TaxID=5970 RepID=H6BXG5_EXODN|nr:uncharacterized protein HMPREF1120_03534 [Exophiala dermatitidis NIH/UT8656]XP_009155857.1 hypothetical protein, variant [Exophiala dermatitidis NIH/UT8656]KAJ4540285.1 hypothetical protein HRR76_003695 [Exophiala dermatitidis]EHY55395.1 hypothetical protein, variant [Exophiala dermatitidis NIH/UT8656]EHY55396.1 hypothetical protein HMPREF1120_03534 [Exophiala dermatitidis NIH/UT8656]KAJ4565106.1 hypothetical protein HRR82_008941 [Exophiala dermatitidis]KAJ4588057.1 hypothetical protein HR